MRPPGSTKRQKETARAEKQRDKAARREQRRADKAERADTPKPTGDLDPDIAGIIPGPQPIIR